MLKLLEYCIASTCHGAVSSNSICLLIAPACLTSRCSLCTVTKKEGSLSMCRWTCVSGERHFVTDGGQLYSVTCSGITRLPSRVCCTSDEGMCRTMAILSDGVQHKPPSCLVVKPNMGDGPAQDRVHLYHGMLRQNKEMF